ncbi:hypothetical protein JCM6882_005930 [Rhodosporidiobolus microsporus]
MSKPEPLIKYTARSVLRTVFAFPLNIDFSKPDFSQKIDLMPFLGDWTLFYQHLCPDDYSAVEVAVKKSDLTTAAKKSYSRFKPSTHRSYRLKVRFKTRPTLPGVVTAQSLATARLVAPLLESPSSHDVCLVFPRAQGLKLYTDKALLTAASPYFANLFSSGFAESSLEPSPKRRRTSQLEPLTTDSQDSDDETDELILKERPPDPNAAPSPSSSSPVHEIVITETAYSTYRALLLYLHTGYIAWADPTSSFLPTSAQTPRESRLECIQETRTASGIDVLPVSPKSMYTLAHFLELDTLATLALAVFASCLHVSTAARELVSPAAGAYDDLRKVVVKFVAANFEDVENSKAWGEVVERVRKGELGEAAPALMELHVARSKERRREEDL